LVNPY